MKTPLLIASCLLLLAPVPQSLAADPSPARLPFRNPDLPVQQRIDDLIERLSFDEKVSQMMMNCPAIPRLGIPAYGWWNEGLHGVARKGVATVFPQAIALAATWDPELHHRIADTISTEVWAKTNLRARGPGGADAQFLGLTIWSPNINIFRDPRWGRGQETYGEDPFLTGRFAVAFVTGLQGDDPHYLKTVATLKHFDVHSGPESLRHQFNAVVSRRDLHETYLPAFETGIREGHAWSVMSAYNAINGIPAPANKLLLTEILRNTWGFPGAVVGDVDTVADITGGHHYTKDSAEGSAAALKAGNDLCSGKTYSALPDALKRGLITEGDVNAALRRLLLVRFKLGQFDPPARDPYTKIPGTENDSPDHEQLALQASKESLVLLKNDGALPWDVKSIKTLAVLGPTADDSAALVGNYNGTPARPVTLLKGLQDKLEPLGVTILREPAVPLVAGFRASGDPIPDSALFTDANRSTHGLNRGVMDPKFTAAQPGTQTDSQLNLHWDEAQPVPGIPNTQAHLRWTGVLVPPVSGDYVLTLASSGGFRFSFDGAVLANQIAKPRGTYSNKFTLQAGHPYPLTIDYAQTGNSGKIALRWQVPGSDTGLDRALAAAKAADHILLTLGITPELEGEQMTVTAEGFSGGDRTSVLLPKSQRDLIDKIAALGKPFVVVLTNGSALSFDIGKPNAILDAWYYGEQGGNAVTDALLGDYNPAGRLPVTFYQSDSDLPPFTDYSMANRTYRYFTGKPLFAFGHGLSYTTFAYNKAALSASQAHGGDKLSVRVEVKNTGSRAGDEVVEVYGHAVKPPVPMPLQQLVGFQRVSIQSGETKEVDIPVAVNSLRRWDEAKNSYVVDPGAYALRIGPSSDQPLLTETLQVQ